MNADEAKCSGRNLLELCPRRDDCDRYVRASAPRQVWMLPPIAYMGTLCPEFVPVTAASRPTPSPAATPR